MSGLGLQVSTSSNEDSDLRHRQEPPGLGSNASRVTLGKPPEFSEPQFAHLKWGHHESRSEDYGRYLQSA